MAITQFTATTVHSAAAHNLPHNELSALTIPIGGIILWSGSVAAIPSGWLLCDGTSGTPDLRSRFIVGAGSTYSVAGTGGEATHTLTAAELPSHYHLPKLPGQYVSSYPHVAGDTMYFEQQQQGSPDGPYSGGNLTTGDVSVAHGSAMNNLPPYYALAYIMKS